jgi:hypothetical protein
MATVYDATTDHSPPKNFFSHFSAIIFNAAPIRELLLIGIECGHGYYRFTREEIAALARCRYLQRLRCLDTLGDLPPGSVQDLVASLHLKNLTSLGLCGGGELSERAAYALANSPHLAGLKRLGLGQYTIGLRAAKALASSPYLTRLQKLYVRDYESSGKSILRAHFGRAVLA